MARPSKYETHVATRFNEIADWLRNGASEKEIADRLGIAYSTFREYKNDFSAFSAVLQKTREQVDGDVENALLKNAMEGNITAQIFWLKNRRPAKWRDKPTEELGRSEDIGFTFKIEDCSGSDET